MESHSLSRNKQRNYSLDLLKFISSFMIICIHFKIAGKTGELLTVISRFAVPVFFMVSGYYACHDDCDKLKRKIINIVKIYFISVVIYFCFNIVVMILKGQIREALWYVSTYLRIQYTSKIFLFNESITAMHLWFLGSLIYSYVVQYLALKIKIKDNVIYLISTLLIITHLVLGIGLPALGIETPEFLLKNYMLRNYLFMGYPLFVFGTFVRKKEDVIHKVISCKVIFILLVISLVDALLVWNIDWSKDLYIGSIISAFALFILALKKKDKKYPRKLLTLFNTSSIVYVIHVMIGEILAMTVLENTMLYAYIKPVVIFGLSVAISVFFNVLVKRIRKTNRLSINGSR